LRASKPFADHRPTVWAGLVVLFVLTVAFYTTDLDLRLARHYFENQHGPWPGRDALWARIPYLYGTFPAYATGVMAALAFFASYRLTSLRTWRGPALYLALLLLLGPGLLVNILAKGLAGRPRPDELVQFGGYWNFNRPWQFGVPGQGRSFISGHVSMAFFWFGLVFLLKERGQRALAFFGVMAFGLWMGLARMAQGAHFLSDVLLCGALLWTLAALLSPLIHWQPPVGFWARPKVLGALALSVAGVLFVGHPVFEQRDFLWVRQGQPVNVLAIQRLQTWMPRTDFHAVALEVDLRRGDLDVDFGAQDDGHLWPLRLDEELRGLGLPGTKASLEATPLAPGGALRVDGDTLSANVTQTLRGTWWMLGAKYHVSLPVAKGVDARLKTARGVLTIAHLPEGRQILLNGTFEAQDLPVGFHAFGEHSWVRDGDQPQISLDLRATKVRFLP